jgi:AcrR family transcriptional regulator
MGIAERRQREKQLRRSAIIDAAEAVFFDKGVEIATMDDVAEEAELSKGTLYLYFKSKEDLYLGITKRGLEILTKMLKNSARRQKRGIDRIHSIEKAYTKFAKKHRDYFQAFVTYNSQLKDIADDNPNAHACEMQREKILAVCAEAIQQGIEDGSIRSSVDPPKAAVILWGQITGILQLSSSKGKILDKNIGKSGFKTLDEMVEYSFSLTRHSLEHAKQ